MTQMALFCCPKQVSSCSSSGGGAPAASPRNDDRCCGGIRRLVRRLRKQGKVLCSARRTAESGCQYDPLSYARNFDRAGFDDDSSQFTHTFSSRFVAPVPAARRRLPPTAGH